MTEEDIWKTINQALQRASLIFPFPIRYTSFLRVMPHDVRNDPRIAWAK